MSISNKLVRLQNLCENANKRYKNNKNDDDQVKALIDFSNNHHEVCLIIGFDEYNAIQSDEVIKMYNENSNDFNVKKEKEFLYLTPLGEGKNYRVHSSLINL